MKTQELKFYSDGLRLDGKLYLPDDLTDGDRRPLVIACSGFLGLYRIHPERFARQLTTRGYVCYGFDYRGHGNSEGQRYRVLLDEQVRDIRNAVTVASRARMVDPNNVFLLGWAMGAGLVIDACRELDEISGIIALNGLYEGRSFELKHRGADGLEEFRRQIREERFRRARSGIAEYVDPFHIYPLDPVTQSYVTDSLEPVEGYETAVSSFEFAESLMRWSVSAIAPEVKFPLFLAHGERNELHPPEQVDILLKVYGGEIQYYKIEGVGHTEWMVDDNLVFQDLCEKLYRWLEKYRTVDKAQRQ